MPDSRLSQLGDWNAKGTKGTEMAFEWRVSHVNLRAGGQTITWVQRSEDDARREVRELQQLAQLRDGIAEIRLERRRVGEWEEVDA